MLFPNTYFRNYLKRDPCVYCGRTAVPGKIKISRDHILPKSRKGKNVWVNLAPTCVPCNTRKSNLSVLEMLLYKEVQSAPRPRLRNRNIVPWDNQTYLPTNWYNPIRLTDDNFSVIL